MKRLSVLILAVCLLLSACASTTPSGADKDSGEKQKIAVVANSATDDHCIQLVEGFQSEGEALGYAVDIFLSNNDDAKFQELFEQCLQNNYVGIYVTHGKADYAYDLLKPAVDKGVKIVGFDTTAEKDGVALEGATLTQQNDHLLAQISLDEICELCPNRPARILKLWFGPGEPPLDRREEIYKEYEQAGKIETLEVVGPTDWNDVIGSVATAISAMLPKYPEGSVDAVWASWDELAKGVYKACGEANRDDLVMVAIDVSNQDLNFMKEENSIWKATAAVDPVLIGRIGMRLMAMKLHGDETPDVYQLEPKLIRGEMLQADSNMDNLDQVIDGWRVSDEFNQPWMDELRAQNAK